jgi:phage gpG-like protein
MQNPLDLHRQRQELKRVMLTLPSVVGDLALQFIDARFRAGGWYDGAFIPWDARSPKAKRNKGRALLINTGRLRRSIRISKLTSSSVTIGTDVPYARVHNEGFNGVVNVKAHERGQFSKSKRGTGKFTKSGKERMQTMTSRTGSSMVQAHTRNMRMPKRQFMGNSQYLNNLLQRKITTEIYKAFQF